VKELMFAKPDVNRDGEFILDGVFNQPTTDCPGGLFVEGSELKLLFI
jgi:hypothetical protein